MGSTPLKQSDQEPRKDADPAAAESSDGTGGPLGLDESEAGPTKDPAAAFDRPKSDMQELSREEVLALISTAKETRKVQKTQDLAVEGQTDSATAGDHAEVFTEPDAPTRSTSLITAGNWRIGFIVLILLLAAFGLLNLMNRPSVKSIAGRQPSADAHPKTSPAGGSRAAADSVPKMTPNGQPPVDGLLVCLKAKQDQMDVLRDQMLSKTDEIANLRHHYKKSIQQVETAVLIEKSHAGIHSLQQALENKRIAFQLETIRLRQAYIDCLAKPADWLVQGSEELLFLKRKHLLQSLIFPVSGQIDPEKLAAEQDAAFDRYAISKEALKIDLQKGSYPSLDQIWKTLLEQDGQHASNRFPNAPDTRLGVGGGSQVNNHSIWLDICRGRFDRKNDLTALSIEAAECLADWKEPDLFLNRIKELSPAAARRLFRWKGSWFCLNGLTKLPPETARYLFQWNGDWLSLNGVKHLSVESSIFLTRWKGRTLELMGLSPESMELETLALKHLSQWQRSGGKLFVPDRIRRLLIDG